MIEKIPYEDAKGLDRTDFYNRLKSSSNNFNSWSSFFRRKVHSPSTENSSIKTTYQKGLSYLSSASVKMNDRYCIKDKDNSAYGCSDEVVEAYKDCAAICAELGESSWKYNQNKEVLLKVSELIRRNLWLKYNKEYGYRIKRTAS